MYIATVYSCIISIVSIASFGGFVTFVNFRGPGDNHWARQQTLKALNYKGS